MSQTNTHVRKGDLVEVISGSHKGSRGTVLQVIKKNPPSGVRVLVEGVNIIKKTVRPTQERQQGGFQEKEAPIHISNVKLVEKKSKES